MIDLNKKYNQDAFLTFLKDFLPDFEKDIRTVGSTGLQVVKKASYLGGSKQLDLGVFELSHSGSQTKRIALATDGFRILKQSATFQALVIFYSADTEEWRLSLMTATPESNERGGVVVRLSNPKRYSFALGEKAKTNTPYNFLIRKGKLVDFEDLKSRFSIEVVNKEFYMEIANLYTKLIGGVRGEGRSRQEFPGIIKLPSVPKESPLNHEFVVRLIGRIIFCWFLREKRSESGLSLIPNALLSLNAAKENSDYYHSIIEPLFFEILNKNQNSRKDKYQKDHYKQIPYLNGGLFSPQSDDYYSSDEGKQSVNYNTLIIPDDWLHEFLEVLERYNFTVDENTSVDIDLSIDPEMLGRIFENLLAEINPETGESARKSTGSYYTPRTIVEYMVDESLYQYLKDKTDIEEAKLRALISYDLSDDEELPLSSGEKEKVVEALSNITILDPACGSGAFPIGALQKIVFMLQRLDPNGQLWFQRQLEGATPEIRRVIEREFAHRNFDYIRKLGVIRESIFGVDIQPIATEIARLRCFLTLVVEERVADEESNRGIEPLPNLDFKFVTANSLIGLPASQQNGQADLFEDQEGIDQLKEVRDMYFNASGTERENLKLQFVQIQNKMFQKMIAYSYYADLTSKLSSWDPFGHRAADWFDSDWMFGIKDGFNIVIANPPYIYSRNKKFTEIEQIYFRSKSNLITHRLNTFVLFIEQGFNLLNKGGVLAFITPNNWLTVDSFYALRNFIFDKAGDTKIVNTYESIFKDASVDTCILILSKTDLHQLTLGEFLSPNKVVFYGTYAPSFFDIVNRIININLTKNKQSTEDLRIINNNSQKLSDIASLKHGIVAYLVGDGIPKQTKEIRDTRAYHSRIKEDKNHLKYLEGKDIGRYRLDWSGNYIKYGKNLARRSQLNYFKGTRILIKQIPSSPPYCINAVFVEEEYINDINCEIIMGDRDNLLYILAVLNSKPFSYWFRLYFDKFQRKIFPQIKLKEMALFAIPKSDSKSVLYLGNEAYSLQKYYHKLSLLKGKENEIIKLKDEINDIENKIDKKVHKLYGLTPEEITAGK